MENNVLYIQNLQEFQSRVVDSAFKSVFLVFVAEWCPPSQQLVKNLKEEIDL